MERLEGREERSSVRKPSMAAYDPRGQVIRTGFNPDGSEQRVIYGIPADVADPERFAPTPWVAYTYDANDNAGRTHADSAQPYRGHWNTPASIVIDAWGRTIEAIARNGSAQTDWLVTRSQYDIRGNLLSVTDAMGRVAFRYGYDLTNGLGGVTTSMQACAAQCLMQSAIRSRAATARVR